MTEMFISAFYAVIDPWAGELRYSNTGHPHAFLLAEGKGFERLAARRSAARHGRATAGHRTPRVECRARSAGALHRRRQPTRAIAAASAWAKSACSMSSTRTGRRAARDPRARRRAARRAHRGRVAPRRSDASSSSARSAAATPRDGRPRGLPPIRKSLGQHFLTDRRILERIVDALELTGEETVDRDRPGAGKPDRAARAARRAVSCSSSTIARSPRMLRERYASNRRRAGHRGRRARPSISARLAGGPFRLVGNVPYYITTPILFHALSAPRPDARRLPRAARGRRADRRGSPGTKEYGALSVNVQACRQREAALPRRARLVSAAAQGRERGGAHRAARRSRRRRRGRGAAFRRFVQDAFGMRRKQMRRVLRSLWSVSAGSRRSRAARRCQIDPSARPETLSPRNFADLVRARPGRA